MRITAQLSVIDGFPQLLGRQLNKSLPVKNWDNIFCFVPDLQHVSRKLQTQKKQFIHFYYKLTFATYWAVFWLVVLTQLCCSDCTKIEMKNSQLQVFDCALVLNEIRWRFKAKRKPNTVLKSYNIVMQINMHVY